MREALEAGITGRAQKSPTRRQVLSLAAAGALTGCHSRSLRTSGETHLRLSTWGEPVEIVAFENIARRYRAVRPKIRVHVEVISYNGRRQVDTLIAAGLGPDIFRVQYQDVGRYSPSGALIDLQPYLPPGLEDEFTPQVWSAVKHNSGVHALPHHTDTSVILYNKPAFARLGVRTPKTLEESWHWEEFVDVARFLRRHGFKNGFAVNWTMGGVFRWLNFLYQHGGEFFASDFRHSALRSQAAVETLRWTQRFFAEELVPRNDSARAELQVEQLFPTEVVPMYFDIGPQALRTLRLGFPYGATFLPRDRRFASELGGNALGINRNTRHPKEAAEFILFATNEENMREFAIAGQFLPVRRSLVAQPLAYRENADEMEVHRIQATTVPVSLARGVTMPSFHLLERKLGNELDMAFTGGQSAEETLERIARATDRLAT